MKTLVVVYHTITGGTRQMAEAIVMTHAQTPAAILQPKSIPAAELGRCEELGLTLASGLALGVF